MSEQEESLYVKLPSTLKYRLDMYATQNRLTLKEATEKILDAGLPEYERK